MTLNVPFREAYYSARKHRENYWKKKLHKTITHFTGSNDEKSFVACKNYVLKSIRKCGEWFLKFPTAHEGETVFLRTIVFWKLPRCLHNPSSMHVFMTWQSFFGEENLITLEAKFMETKFPIWNFLSIQIPDLPELEHIHVTLILNT